MEGKRDPDCRRGMIWDHSRWDHDLLAFVKHMIALRHAHTVLRRGRFKPLLGAANHLAAVFERRLVVASAGETVVAIVAFNADSVAVEMDLQGLDPGTYVDMVGGLGGNTFEKFEISVPDSGRCSLKIPPRRGFILMKQAGSHSHL